MKQTSVIIGLSLLSATKHFYLTSRCQVKIPRLDKGVDDYQCLFERIRSATGSAFQGGKPDVYSLQASMNSEAIFSILTFISVNL
jgi:hypothetical protein